MFTWVGNNGQLLPQQEHRWLYFLISSVPRGRDGFACSFVMLQFGRVTW